MICPGNRTFDADHVSCRSCLRQGIKCPQQSRKKVRVAVVSGPAGPGRWMTTLDLTSPNDWTNKNNGRRIYARCKQQWKKALSGAQYHLGVAQGMRRVEIVRYAPRGRLMDKDNCYGSTKPAVDFLVSLGVLLDDDLEHLDLDVRQEVGLPRVEFTIKEVGGDKNSAGPP